MNISASDGQAMDQCSTNICDPSAKTDVDRRLHQAFSNSNYKSIVCVLGVGWMHFSDSIQCVIQSAKSGRQKSILL